MRAPRRPGQPWRPGTPAPAPVAPDTPSADIRIGYARCSTLTQELQTQLDALAVKGIPRDKIFSAKISTRSGTASQFEAALTAAREVKAHAPRCRVIFAVYEMHRLGRDAAELTVLADHLTAHRLVLEMLPGLLQGMYDPSGPGRLLFGFFAAMAAARTAKPSRTSRPTCSSSRPRTGRNPSLPSIYWTLAEYEKTRAYPEAVETAHADFVALQQRDRSPK